MAVIVQSLPSSMLILESLPHQDCDESNPKTLIMLAKRVWRHNNEAGKIWKSSWNVSLPIVHSEPTQFCVSSIHITSPMRTGVTLAEEGSPTMHSLLQVPQCFFQSEPPPFSVICCFLEPRILCEGHTRSVARQQQPIVLHRPVSGKIGLFLASLQYRTYHFIIHSLIVLLLPTFLPVFLSFCVC